MRLAQKYYVETNTDRRFRKAVSAAMAIHLGALMLLLVIPLHQPKIMQDRYSEFTLSLESAPANEKSTPADRQLIPAPSPTRKAVSLSTSSLNVFKKAKASKVIALAESKTVATKNVPRTEGHDDIQLKLDSWPLSTTGPIYQPEQVLVPPARLDEETGSASIAVCQPTLRDMDDVIRLVSRVGKVSGLSGMALSSGFGYNRNTKQYKESIERTGPDFDMDAQRAWFEFTKALYHENWVLNHDKWLEGMDSLFEEYTIPEHHALAVEFAERALDALVRRERTLKQNSTTKQQEFADIEGIRVQLYAVIGDWKKVEQSMRAFDKLDEHTFIDSTKYNDLARICFLNDQYDLAILAFRSQMRCFTESESTDFMADVTLCRMSAVALVKGDRKLAFTLFKEAEEWHTRVWKDVDNPTFTKTKALFSAMDENVLAKGVGEAR